MQCGNSSFFRMEIHLEEYYLLEMTQTMSLKLMKGNLVMMMMVSSKMQMKKLIRSADNMTVMVGRNRPPSTYAKNQMVQLVQYYHLEVSD